MKRTLTAVGAVLYLAACWAPQLWTGAADAQEKKEPEVLEEVRARRIVLVDDTGAERAVLEMEKLTPILRLTAGFSRERDSASLSPIGLVTRKERPSDDGTWSDAGGLMLASPSHLGPMLLMQRTFHESRSVRTTRVSTDELLIVRRDATDASTEPAVRSARVHATTVELEANDAVRAAMGLLEPEPGEAGTESTREGAFVSYDVDGNVLWMEPR